MRTDLQIILLASGKGKRLVPETLNVPKALVKVNEKTILDYFLNSAYKVCNRENIIIATGHNHKCFESLGIKLIFNPFYEETNMLFGLWYTLSKMSKINSGIIVSFSDIIFPEDTLRNLISSEKITIVTDKNWEKRYIGRTDHPQEQCAKCILDSKNKLLIASKKLPKVYKNIYSEFLGLLYIPKDFINVVYEKLSELYDNEENYKKPFIFSDDLKNAYLTDFFTFLVMNQFEIKSNQVTGEWFEIDTLQDLKKAKDYYQ